MIANEEASDRDRSDNPMVRGRSAWVIAMAYPVVHRIWLCAVIIAGSVSLAVAQDLRDQTAAQGQSPKAPPLPRVEIKTSMGTIMLELEAEKAPLTVANFLKYVEQQHYDGTVFHRVVGGYMIQGGGFEKQGDRLVEKPTGTPIKNEAGNGLSNRQGTVAMARTDVPDSATAQFFINGKDNDMLDQSTAAAGYAVFGRVIEGFDVVRQINEVQTGVREVMGRLGNGQLRPMPLKGVPLSDVVIESARVVTPAAAQPVSPEPSEAEAPDPPEPPR